MQGVLFGALGQTNGKNTASRDSRSNCVSFFSIGIHVTFIARVSKRDEKCLERDAFCVSLFWPGNVGSMFMGDTVFMETITMP